MSRLCRPAGVGIDSPSRQVSTPAPLKLDLMDIVKPRYFSPLFPLGADEPTSSEPAKGLQVSFYLSWVLRLKEGVVSNGVRSHTFYFQGTELMLARTLTERVVVLSFFLEFLRPNLITRLRPNVNTLTLLVRTSIDYFIFHTLLGAIPITQMPKGSTIIWKSPTSLRIIPRF